MTAVEDVELVAGPTPAAVSSVRRDVGLLVRPAAHPADIREAFEAYRDLCTSLLVEDDYQTIGSRRYRKKSGWRKLAVAFGVSCEILRRDYERNDAGRIVRAEVVVRATAPNSRFMDGLGACDLFERCCAAPCPLAGQRGHTCCTATTCTGTPHFQHPQHDIPATASTRATNRACADLFGMGEVSAEEILTDGESVRPGSPVAHAAAIAAAPVVTDEHDPWRDVLGNPGGWFDNRAKKREPGANTRLPDFKARNTNVLWKDRDGQPAPVALWIGDAPEGFEECLALLDMGLPVDLALLDDAAMATTRERPPEKMKVAELVQALLALGVRDARGSKKQLAERLRAARAVQAPEDVGTEESGTGDGPHGAGGTVLTSSAPLSDPTAGYARWTRKWLVTECRGRDRTPPLAAAGNKARLVERLRVDDTWHGCPYPGGEPDVRPL